MKHYKQFYSGKKILVTGVAGTVGKGIVKELLKEEGFQPSEVVGIDNNESELFFVEQEFASYKNANFALLDIKDSVLLDEYMQGVNIVIHAAALKHVVLCEKSPMQAVNTNIVALNSLIYAAKRNKVEYFIFTSSDKAVNPTNVMGTSKLMGERLVTAANGTGEGENKTIFASTRFGNVLGSNGSVIPVFHRQIMAQNAVTLTDKDMTRFVMSLEQAVDLVLSSCCLAKGGEVFITKMPVVRIENLAEVMIDHYSKKYALTKSKISIIGKKAGEKLYEELMSHEETSRALELEDYFVVTPAFKDVYSKIDYAYDTLVSKVVDNPYLSSEEKAMTNSEIKSFLLTNKLI